MSVLAYPITLTEDSNGTLLVGFVDFPECHSVGLNKNDAIFEAVDALKTVMEMYILDGKVIPRPSNAAKGQHVIRPW